MAGKRLIVEVVAAEGLMPKDGQGTTNAYCVVCTQRLASNLISSQEMYIVRV